MNTPTRHGLLIGVVASCWFAFAAAVFVASPFFGDQLNLFPFGIAILAFTLVLLFSGSEDYEPRHRRFLYLTGGAMMGASVGYSVSSALLEGAAAAVARGEFSYSSLIWAAYALDFPAQAIFPTIFILPTYHVFEKEERRLSRYALYLYLGLVVVIEIIQVATVGAANARIDSLLRLSPPDLVGAQSEIRQAVVTTTLMEVPLFLMLLPFSFIFVRAYLKAKRFTAARIDDVFIIANDGRLMHHATRRLEPTMDYDILAGMFKAVLDFMNESFEKKLDRSLSGFQMGDYYIALQRGAHVTVAIACKGIPESIVREKLRKVLEVAESSHSKKVEVWDGRRESIRGFADEIVAGMRLSRIT